MCKTKLVLFTLIVKEANLFLIIQIKKVDAAVEKVFIFDFLTLFFIQLSNDFKYEEKLEYIKKLSQIINKMIRKQIYDENKNKIMPKNNHLMIELSMELLLIELRSDSLSSPDTSLLMILLALLRTYNVFLAVSLCWVISGGSHKLSIKASFFKSQLYKEYCISY